MSRSTRIVWIVFGAWVAVYATGHWLNGGNTETGELCGYAGFGILLVMILYTLYEVWESRRVRKETRGFEALPKDDQP